MSKISKIWSRFEAVWYSELRNVARYNEADFDAVIKSQLETIFPHFIFVPYAKTIKAKGTPTGSNPDFALVRADYEEWWIVEVETIGDKLSRVQGQIRNFTEAGYDAYEHAQYIHSKQPELDFDRLLVLTDSTPKVLVIVDDINSQWIEGLKDYGPTICVFKVYINGNGTEMYNISGDYPYIWEAESFCSFSPPLRNVLELASPQVLLPPIRRPIPRMGRIRKVLTWFANTVKGDRISQETPDIYRITHRGKLTEWQRLDDNGKTYLQPLRNHTLGATSQFVLKRLSSEEYLIEVIR